VLAEGAYIWNLEVTMVVVGIDPMSHEYETSQLLILPGLPKPNLISSLSNSFLLNPS
jgi:hypothetical protein